MSHSKSPKNRPDLETTLPNVDYVLTASMMEPKDIKLSAETNAAMYEMLNQRQPPPSKKLQLLITVSNTLFSECTLCAGLRGMLYGSIITAGIFYACGNGITTDQIKAGLAAAWGLFQWL